MHFQGQMKIKVNCGNTPHMLVFSCAKANLKKVSLELGGKSPLVIFSDCDLDKAVRMVGSLRRPRLTFV